MIAADFLDVWKSSISSRYCTGTPPKNFLRKKRKFFAAVRRSLRHFAPVNDKIAGTSAANTNGKFPASGFPKGLSGVRVQQDDGQGISWRRELLRRRFFGALQVWLGC